MAVLKRLVVLLCCVFIIDTTAGVTYAHDFKSAFGVTVELHLEPSQTPKAKNRTRLQLGYTDPTGNFNFRDCTCVLYINSETKNVAKFTKISSPPNDPSHFVTNYTFPEAGTYQAALTASPKGNARFKPFTIVYDKILVTKPAKSQLSSLLLTPTLISFGMVVGLYVINRNRVRRHCK